MSRFEEKAKALVSQMTLEEAALQLRYDAPAIPRLGVPAYNWWNEALHGVARAGTATVFPQAVGLAASFDPELLEKIADVISTEARAKYNMQSENGDRDIYKGLTMWSPNVNIFRDQRWGRGQETYGEDPYLTAELGAAFIKGLQGDKEHLKVAACAKHFAAHSGPEELRHGFDAVASPKDMEETYLPAFEKAVETGVESVMGAYNRTNGEPCCGSKTLLEDTLRKKWGFKGHVVSDCWAILDFHQDHHVTEDVEHSAALALNNGCDLNCGTAYHALNIALEKGLVTEERVREAAVRLMTTRFKLGILGDEHSEYDNISYLENDTEEHRAFSRVAAEKTAVLLKNDGILPLKKEKLKTIAVIGPTADSRAVLEGNYFGTASEYVTNLEGIREAAGTDIRVLYSIGSHLYKTGQSGLSQPDDRLAEAVGVAKLADAVILCVGLDATIEGEQGDAGNSFAAGDKLDLLLPESQRKLLDAVLPLGKPVVLVLNSGSALDVSAYEPKVGAILQAWYSGAQGGRALANLLFGKVSPSGKLPISFPKDGTMPEFTDYSMKNRTYKFAKAEDTLYPFGFGLSYTTFEHSDSKYDTKTRKGSVTVKNAGAFDGDEVVEIFVNYGHRRLAGMKRVSLKAGESKTVEFEISEKSLTEVKDDGSRVPFADGYTVETV
ncbi:glycosyl hydrolase [Clostridia bacterium]|nr:glycosyl hydrolase [Clostridia bacterium]